MKDKVVTVSMIPSPLPGVKPDWPYSTIQVSDAPFSCHVRESEYASAFVREISETGLHNSFVEKLEKRVIELSEEQEGVI